LLASGGPKRFLDVVVAGLGLFVAGPFMLATAIAIKVESKGPVIFAQTRVGKDGNLFTMYKFRSMVVDAQAKGTGLFSYENDPRVTRVGDKIRRLSIDELPQLFNVLNGTMSIVGPRPPVENELGAYEDLDDEWKVRFRVNPGITGLAQVSGRNELEWPDKIVHDNRYVQAYRRWGILYDLLILARTPLLVLAAKDTIEPERDT